MIFGAQLSRFLQQNWGKEIYRDELTPSVMASLKSELHELDVHTMAQNHEGPIAVRFGEGQSKSVAMSRANALAFYDAGYEICLREFSRPLLREWCEHLSRALELPNHFSCELIAATRSHPRALCFDALENITLQLIGTDTWSASVGKELALTPQAPLEPRCELCLMPGQLLYVPRGVWHATGETVNGPVMSLVLSAPVVTWADLIAPALRSLLLRDARWRENAKMLSPQASRAERAHFASVLQEAADQLATLDLSFLVPWKPSEPSRLSGPALPARIVRNLLATVTYEDGGAQHVKAISRVHLGPYTRTFEAEIPADLQPVLEFFCARQELSIKELQDAIAGVASLEAVFASLCELDLVRPKGSSEDIHVEDRAHPAQAGSGFVRQAARGA